MALHVRFNICTFLSHSLSANRQHEMTKSQVLRKTRAHKGKSLIFFLSFNTVHPNSVPGYIGYFVEVEQTGIITKPFKKHKLALLNDIFAAVAVLQIWRSLLCEIVSRASSPTRVRHSAFKEMLRNVWKKLWADCSFGFLIQIDHAFYVIFPFHCYAFALRNFNSRKLRQKSSLFSCSPYNKDCCLEMMFLKVSTFEFVFKELGSFLSRFHLQNRGVRLKRLKTSTPFTPRRNCLIKLSLTKWISKSVTEKCGIGFSMRFRWVSIHALICAKFVVDKNQYSWFKKKALWNRV